MATTEPWFRVCNEVAPPELATCPGPGYRECGKVKGHSGVHGNAPSGCNRPGGHDGPHMVLTFNAERLAVWPNQGRQ